MHLTSAELTAWVGAFMWPFFRIAAMTSVAPVFAARSVPARVRLLFALALTIPVAPLLPPAPAVDPLSAAAALITAQQIVVGLALGFALQLTFSAFVTGGQVVAMQMGLGFAAMVDPQNGSQTPVVSQLYLLMATLIFLALGGHLVLIETLVDSFRSLPVGVQGLAPENVWQLVLFGSQLFAGAVSIAIPAIASLLIVNLAFGVMTRSAPQLNIFAVGFPITMVLGFAVILATLPSVLPRTDLVLADSFRLLRQLAGGGG